MVGGAKNRNSALALTFCGIMAALGAVIMIAGGFLTIAQYSAPMLASVCLIPMMVEFGASKAWMGYAVTAIVTALLCPDKELAFFYVFIGYYPMLREEFNRIRPTALKWVVKIAFFSAATALLYLFLCFVLKLDAVLSELSEYGNSIKTLLFIGLVALLVLYDIALGAAFGIYKNKLRPKLKFLK